MWNIFGSEDNEECDSYNTCPKDYAKCLGKKNF